jgi:hypothetical protein
VDLLAVDEPWVASVYEQTSGYIHLSGKHIFNSLSMEDLTDRTIEFKVGVGDTVVPEPIYSEAIDAFEAATDLFLREILSWVMTKESVAAASTRDPAD